MVNLPLAGRSGPPVSDHTDERYIRTPGGKPRCRSNYLAAHQVTDNSVLAASLKAGRPKRRREVL